MAVLIRRLSCGLAVLVAAFMIGALAVAGPASGAEDPEQDDADDPVAESTLEYPPLTEEFSPLVYGGYDAVNPGWITALFDDGWFICTASLIDPQVVLTAAHCVDGPGTYSVLIGEEFLYASGIRRTVTDVYVHPGWGRNFNDTDLALLVLDSPVTSVPVARLNTTGAWPEWAQSLGIAGWGEYYEGSGVSSFLQAGDVFATSGMDGTYDASYCDLDPAAMTVGGMFCFGGPVTVGSCSGDSGGPVFGWSTPSANSGDIVIYGLVSYGPTHCGVNPRDDKAQSVGGHYDWIMSVVNSITGPVDPVDPIDPVNVACPVGTVPDAGFVDVDAASPHKESIDCIAWWKITTGKTPTTFDPAGSLLRSQMALFLIRTYDALFHGGEVPGSPQGFTDIGSLSAEAQKAINQLKELSITSGTSPTTYEPDGVLTRTQMALFLTRLLRAEGVTLPDGADQGFTDIGNVSPEAQKAINQMKQLGITAGVTPTTYYPSGKVTRAQMASFIARTLNISVSLGNITWDDAYSCNDAEPEVCTWNATFSANVPFTVRDWWYTTPPPAPPDFSTPSTRIELKLDGQPVTLTDTVQALNAIVYKYFAVTFPTGLTTGNHAFEWRFYDRDVLARITTGNISFTE